jgi:DNA-directed RNA polymerase subunit RPC12/RpoP
MIDLKCPNCSASISLDETREYGFCSYCGTKIQLVQKVRMIHEGTVNVGGIKTEQQQIESAKKMIEIGEYGEAKRLLNGIIEYSPDCGEAWLELSIVSAKDVYIPSTSNCTNMSVDFLKNDILKQLEKSKEYNIAKKILGYKVDAIIEKIVAQRANEIFLNSEKRINEIAKNPHILFGYQNRSKLYIYNHIENPSDALYIFFENRGEVWIEVTFEHGTAYSYGDIRYYKANSVNDKTIWAEFKTHYGDCITKPIPKHIEIKILFVDEEKTLYTTLGNFSNYGNKRNDIGRSYENMINMRRKDRKCEICGETLSFRGKCPAQCYKYIK